MSYTLWVWPYFTLQNERRALRSGLTKEQAEEVIEKVKDDPTRPGMLYAIDDGTGEVAYTTE